MIKKISKSKWKNALISKNGTIQDAIKSLDASALQIVLVIDERQRLFGTISDGDIRRGLLKGMKITEDVISIINRHPLIVPKSFSIHQVSELMILNKIQQIPIVDEKNYLLGLHQWDELDIKVKNYSNYVVIMAGGLGTRLHPLTEDCPKPMLLIGGKPMLEHIILRAKAEGFYNFIISINYLGHMIKDYFGSGDKLGVKIEYISEIEPMGTVGALSLLDPIPGKPVIVVNGDVISDVRFSEILNFHLAQESNATMAVRFYEWENPFGVVKLEGINIVGFEEKPLIHSYINAGVYVLSPIAIDHLEKKGVQDMPDLFKTLWKKNITTVAYPMHEDWIDVGRPADLNNANKIFD